MRATFGPIRLVLLVAAGVTSGYLWRAALEPGSAAPVALPAPQVAPLPTITFGPTQPTAPERPVKHGPRPAPNRRGSGPSLAARQVPASTGSHGGGTAGSVGSGRAPVPPQAPKPKPPPKNPPKPTPSPGPSPSPNPAPSTSQPAPTDSTTPPAVQPSPPPPVTPPPSSNDDGRPGWGHGDDNHDHGGPPGDGRGKGK